jgi:thioredoxin-like negative regulator of GroEL
MAAGRFGVQSIPTLLVLKDGVESDVSVGVTPPAKLRKMVEAALS